jgi:hypothetical protein
MGWTFFHKPVGKKAVDAIKAEFPETAKKIVASSATREAVFFVIETHAPDSDVYVPDANGNIRPIIVIAIKAGRGDYNFGYKDMDETMGPYGCAAPMSIIAQASELRDPIGPLPQYASLQSARNYRAGSAAVAAQKALKRSLKPGSKVKLAEPMKFSNGTYQTFTVEKARVRGRKGMSMIFRAENGAPCLISARDLAGATVEA